YNGVTWDLLEWEEPLGAVVPYGDATQPLQYVPVATALPTVAAEMVLHSARTLYDDGVMMRHTPWLHRLAPGAAAHLHPDDARRIGAREGHRVRLQTKKAEAELEVVFDDTLHRGVVYVPFNQPDGARLGSDPIVRVTAIGRSPRRRRYDREPLEQSRCRVLLFTESGSPCSARGEPRDPTHGRE